MTIDPTATYSVLGSDLINCITQAGYAKASLLNVETHAPNYRQIDVDHHHAVLNHQALITANAVKDSGGSPLPSDTFGGSGTVTGTTPSSGGTNKGP